MSTATSTEPAVTIGAGSAIHIAYFVGDKVTGSACNPYAWQKSRVRISHDAPTCPRCEKAIHRRAQSR